MTVNLEERKLRYLVTKNIASDSRLRRQREFIGAPPGQSLHATYLASPSSRQRVDFAALHGAL